MDEFLAIATSFPTAVYAALLLMSMLYWLIGMIGLVDGDAGLDGAGAKIDGAADGALEAASAKIDGAADGALEAASAKVDGAAEAVEGAGGVLASIASILGLLRLRNAPLTITLTALWLFAFAASFLGARYVAPLLPGLLGELLVLVGAFFAAVPFASLVTRPLAGVFTKNVGRSKRDLLGRSARVRISAEPGERAQVRVRIGGDDLLLRVRAETALAKNTEVLLVDYDVETDTFVVEAMSEVLDAGSGDPQR
ncbi:MAG: DUF1449 family protein [Sandaracinus sp.]|nr:DUF1449 family protein [Sandaracinus sp.]MCB9617330.1 DUF1449 family protein [Sandaracinus sp.]